MASADPVQLDLNTTIAAAINAKIEAAVVAAISGDAVLGQFVAAALNQPVTVKTGYREVQSTFMHEAIRKSLQGAVDGAVREMLVEETDRIKAEVAKALRRAVPAIADKLVGQMTEAAARTYGIEVHLKYPNS